MSSKDTKGKIIIDIQEEENTVLDQANQIKEIGAKGKLSVKNPSSEHRLWNLELSLDKTDFTNLPKISSRQSLEPGQTWDFEYTIDNVKEPILKLEEIIDTSGKEEGINHNFVKGAVDKSTFLFRLTNVSDKQIQDIKLTKQIPEYMKDLKIIKESGGKANLNLEDKSLEWICEMLDPEQTYELIVEGIPNITDSELKSGNEVEITYKSEMNQRSAVVPSIEALTDTMTGIDKDEDSDTPGKWNCEIEFENESDFEVTVKKLVALKKDASGADKIVEIEPSAVVGPEGTWTHEFSVESPAVPTIETQLEFTVNYTVPTRIIGKIVKEPTILSVLETSVSKQIEPPTVKANANTDMKITNTITNEGTANIDKVYVEDIIPKDFEPPTAEQLTSKIVDKDGSVVATLGSENVQIEINPDDQESTKSHTIIINYTGLDESFTPGNKLIIEYPIIARNPLPNVKYETPIKIKSQVLLPGPAYEDTTPEIPVIGIQYVKRKIKTAKSISPGANEGEFNVTVKIENKGGVELENISVIETIPKGFKAGDFTPEDLKPEFEETPNGGKLTWHIARLDPGQRLKIKYVATGEGDFPRTEPEVIIAEPESLKTADKSAMTATISTDTAVEESFKEKNAAIVNDIFNEVKRKLENAMSYTLAAETLEKMRDDLINEGKSSPVLHEIMVKTRELKKGGDKMLVGQELEEFLKEFENWRKRLIA